MEGKNKINIVDLLILTIKKIRLNWFCTSLFGLRKYPLSFRTCSEIYYEEDWLAWESGREVSTMEVPKSPKKTELYIQYVHVKNAQEKKLSHWSHSIRNWSRFVVVFVYFVTKFSLELCPVTSLSQFNWQFNLQRKCDDIQCFFACKSLMLSSRLMICISQHQMTISLNICSHSSCLWSIIVSCSVSRGMKAFFDHYVDK